MRKKNQTRKKRNFSCVRTGRARSFRLLLSKRAAGTHRSLREVETKGSEASREEGVSGVNP
jgi:hypothetical protein